MFQLSTEECENLKSQIATSSWGEKRKLPYAFTEQGIYMLATVLRGELAEQQSIFIMRAFREMRHYIKQNQQFATQAEMHLVSAKVSEISVQVASMADRQKFEADVAYIDIYQQAMNSIYIVDDYVNTKTLQLLSQKNQGVEVILFTENRHGKKKAVVNDFITQYPSLRIKPNPDCRDRWIIIDDICYAGEATPDIRIKEAAVLRGGMLLLTFSTGEQRIFDTTRLTGSAFLPLRNEKILSDFKIFHGVMTWMNGEIDIAPDTMYADSYPYTARKVSMVMG